MNCSHIISIFKKLWRGIIHNKLQCLIIGVLWVLFALSILAILHKIGFVSNVLGVSSNADEINEVFYNLSYSYLAGVIFFLVNDWVPRQFREIKARHSLSKEIQQLKLSLDEIHRIVIFITHNKLKQSKGEVDTKQNPFSGFIWCKYGSPHTKQEIKQIDVKKQLSKEANDVLQIIDRLIKSPLFFDINKSLAKLFIDFQSEPFIVSAARKESIEVTANNFEKLYLELEDKFYIQTNIEFYSVPSPYECDNEIADQLINKNN